MKNRTTLYIFNISYLIGFLICTFLFLYYTSKMSLILSTILLTSWMITDYHLSSSLHKKFDYLSILIFIFFFFPFLIFSLIPELLEKPIYPVFLFIPIIINIALFIFKLRNIRLIDLEISIADELTYYRRLYFSSFVMIILVLLIKSKYLFELIPVGLIFITSIGLLMSHFRKIERNYYVFFTFITLVLVYLSTTVYSNSNSEYNIFFNFTFVIITLISLLHIIPISRITKFEIVENTKKKRKKRK